MGPIKAPNGKKVENCQTEGGRMVDVCMTMWEVRTAGA